MLGVDLVHPLIKLRGELEVVIPHILDVQFYELAFGSVDDVVILVFYLEEGLYANDLVRAEVEDVLLIGPDLLDWFLGFYVFSLEIEFTLSF